MFKEIGGDEYIKSIDIELVHPGESVRIVLVKDVIEPRVKVEGNGGIFPEVISKIEFYDIVKGSISVLTKNEFENAKKAKLNDRISKFTKKEIKVKQEVKMPKK